MIGSVATGKLISGGDVRWVRDANSTIIIKHDTRQVIRLVGSAAVVWDWLNLGYSFAKIVPMLALMQAVSETQAEQHLRAFLADWQLTGLLTFVGSEGSYG
jgi:hypothetical protein